MSKTKMESAIFDVEREIKMKLCETKDWKAIHYCCCGSIFEPDEISIITRYDTWVNLTEEICGDDVYGVH